MTGHLSAAGPALAFPSAPIPRGQSRSTAAEVATQRRQERRRAAREAAAAEDGRAVLAAWQGEWRGHREVADAMQWSCYRTKRVLRALRDQGQVECRPFWGWRVKA